MSTTDTSSPSPYSHPNHHHHHDKIKLNIGGKHFETTTTTLNSTTITSLLTTHNHQSQQPIFVDRDPDLFSPLLSLLRTHHLPSSSSFSLSLLNESHFYNLHSPLISSLSPPPLLPFDCSLSPSSPLSPPSDSFISTFSLSPHSLLLAHNSGLISSFNPTTLLLSSTVPTHLDHISSISSLSPQSAALGSTTTPGLHFYDPSTGTHLGSTHWVDPSDLRTHKSRVTAITNHPSGSSIFASFACQHGENTVLMVDKQTLKPLCEIGRQSGTAGKSVAVNKLTWTPEVGVLVGSSVTRGAFGYSGYVRLWDPRSRGEVVWETSEPGGLGGRSSRFGDPMADVDADLEGLFIAKVCSRSGDVGVADLRKLGHGSDDNNDPWVYLEDSRSSVSSGGVNGESLVVHCYNKHVFVGRGGGLEAWSRVEERERNGENDWGGYRRNHVDKVEDLERGVIRKIEGGGNRLFVSRENVEGVEVWESSNSSGVMRVL